MNYSKWIIQVNEANEGINKIKWSSSPREWKMNQIDNENRNNKKKQNRNEFVNNESWVGNDEGWIINDERQTLSLLFILSISPSHSLINSLCHTFSLTLLLT